MIANYKMTFDFDLSEFDFSALDMDFSLPIMDFPLPGDEIFPKGASTREMGTQTMEGTDYEAALCSVLHCMKRKKVGRRCRAHLKPDGAELKSGVPTCFKCPKDTYSAAYKGCREHEMEIGNMSSEGEFIVRRVSYKTCVARRCYRSVMDGWRCSHHEKHGICKYKYTMVKCKLCPREIYGKGQTKCKLHL